MCSPRPKGSWVIVSMPSLPSQTSTRESCPGTGFCSPMALLPKFHHCFLARLWFSLGLPSVPQFWCVPGLNKCYAQKEENWIGNHFRPHSDWESFLIPASSCPAKLYHHTSVYFHDLPSLPTLPWLVASSSLPWSTLGLFTHLPVLLSSTSCTVHSPQNSVDLKPKLDHITPTSSVAPRPTGSGVCIHLV